MLRSIVRRALLVPLRCALAGLLFLAFSLPLPPFPLPPRVWGLVPHRPLLLRLVLLSTRPLLVVSRPWGPLRLGF